MADDFKVKVLARTDKNESDITSHDERIEALEGRLETPEQIALLLEKACSDSKKLDKLFADIFVSMLRDDKINPAVKEAVIALIGKNDRNVFFSSMKTWGKWVAGGLWSIGLLILGSWLGHIWK